MSQQQPTEDEIRRTEETKRILAKEVAERKERKERQSKQSK